MTRKTTTTVAKSAEQKPVASAKSVADQIHRGGSYRVDADGKLGEAAKQTKPGLTTTEKRAKAEAEAAKNKGA